MTAIAFSAPNALNAACATTQLSTPPEYATITELNFDIRSTSLSAFSITQSFCDLSEEGLMSSFKAIAEYFEEEVV